MKRRLLFIAALFLFLFTKHADAVYVNGIWCHGNDSTMVAKDTTLAEADIIHLDSVAAVSIDSVATDTLVHASIVDSLSVPTLTDSLIVALPADSLAVAKDSLIVALPADSLAVAKDSLKNEKKAMLDSLNIVFEQDCKIAKKELNHFKVNPRSDKEYKNLLSYYKNKIKEGYVENFPDAYKAWKEAFNSRKNRNIDLYFDGVAIILGCVMNDTLNKKYDNLGMHREEIEELYNIAVENVDDLNRQLDFTNKVDTITVAELRSQQIKYYNQLWIMDKLYHSTDTAHKKNYADTETRKYWTDVHHKDSIDVYKLYPWYCDIVYSNATNVESMHLSEFAAISHMKVLYDIRKFDLIGEGKAFKNTIKNRVENDYDKTQTRIDQLMAIETNPDKQYNNKIYKANIESDFAEALSAYIDNFEDLEKHYSDLWKKTPTIETAEQIRNSALKKNQESAIYIEASRALYKESPTYELALDIIERYKACKEYKQTIKYYKDVVSEFEEFKQLTDFEKAKIYVEFAAVQIDSKQPSAAYKNLCEAMQLAPDYPEPYYFVGEMHAAFELGQKYADDNMERFRYCIATDYYNKALKMLKDLESMQEMTDTKSNLKEDGINKRMSMCISNLPTKSDVHNAGNIVRYGKDMFTPVEGQTLTISRWGDKFTFTIRFAKEGGSGE